MIDRQLLQIVRIPTVRIVVDVDYQRLHFFACQCLLGLLALLLATVAPRGTEKHQRIPILIATIGKGLTALLAVEVGKVGHLAALTYCGGFSQPATQQGVMVGMPACVRHLPYQLAQRPLVDVGHLPIEDERGKYRPRILLHILAQKSIGVCRPIITLHQVAVFAIGTRPLDNRGIGTCCVDMDADFRPFEVEIQGLVHRGVLNRSQHGLLHVAREEKHPLVGLVGKGMCGRVAIVNGEGKHPREAALPANLVVLPPAQSRQQQQGQKR